MTDKEFGDEAERDKKVPAELELGSEAEWLVPVEEPGDALAWLRRLLYTSFVIKNRPDVHLGRCRGFPNQREVIM